ncbi:iron dependent repressor [Natrinema ejinorense]|uniref:Iron dependent repressor n=2 Tax=Natrinema ejinorense TaxID=373386 RepID=A0A2A5QQG1_9EURY|nr:iron dependent repressor [Natrinema ejinorense]
MTSAASPADIPDTVIPRDSLSPTAGWYLLTVSRLSSRGDRQVRTGELADRLAISPASATEMAGTLADDGLLEYEKYAGLETTARGTEIAESLAWRQCVVTSFFDRLLAYEIDARTAYRIGYTVPEDGIHRLQERIDEPRIEACQRLRGDDDECLVATRVES